MASTAARHQSQEPAKEKGVAGDAGAESDSPVAEGGQEGLGEAAADEQRDEMSGAAGAHAGHGMGNDAEEYSVVLPSMEARRRAEEEHELPHFWTPREPAVLEIDPAWDRDALSVNAVKVTPGGVMGLLNGTRKVFELVARETFAGWASRGKKRAAEAREDLDELVAPTIVTAIDDYVRDRRRARRRAKAEVERRLADGESAEDGLAVLPAVPYDIRVTASSIGFLTSIMDATADEAFQQVFAGPFPGMGRQFVLLPKGPDWTEGTPLELPGRFLTGVGNVSRKKLTVITHARVVLTCVETYPQLNRLADLAAEGALPTQQVGEEGAGAGSEGVKIRTNHALVLEAQFRVKTNEQAGGGPSQTVLEMHRGWRVIDINNHFSELSFNDKLRKAVEWVKERSGAAN